MRACCTRPISTFISRRSLGGLGVLLLASMVLMASVAGAQEPTRPAPSTTPTWEANPYAATPRAAVSEFLEASRRGHFRQAASFLDLSALPKESLAIEGVRLARRLYLVLLLHAWVEPATVSDQPVGSVEQGLEEPFERIATAQIRGRGVDILLQRRVETPLRSAWLFSRETVAVIDSVYRAHGAGWIGDHLPLLFFYISFAGLQLWQWTTLALILSLGWIIARIVGHVIVLILAAMARRTEVTWDDALVRSIDGPLGFLIWGLSLALTSPLVGLAPKAQRLTAVGWKLLSLIGLAWLLLRAWGQVTTHLKERAEDLNQVVVSYVPIITRSGNVLIGAIILLGAFDVVGINVLGLMAGIGIGGLAIAFAAQKSIEDLFGALTIASSRPFSVGDYVTAGQVTGTVEEVRLRTTRIRTLERTLATIPNGALVASTIVNLTSRDRFIFNPTIGVLYGTNVAQLTFIIDETRKLLMAHPRVWQDSHRVRFRAFGASSMDIEVLSWVLAADFNEYTAVAEELNFRIAEIVEASGSSFAFPSRTVYMAQDTGMDSERAAAAQRRVEERRARGDLAVPEPSDELREKLRPALPPED